MRIAAQLRSALVAVKLGPEMATMKDLLSSPYGLAAFITLLLLLDAAATAALLFKAARREDIQEVDFENLTSAEKKVRGKDSKYHFSRNFERMDVGAPPVASLTINGKGEAVLTTCTIGDNCTSTPVVLFTLRTKIISNPDATQQTCDALRVALIWSRRKSMTVEECVNRKN
jgi:hypothetical protein